MNWRKTYSLSSPVMIDPTSDMYDPYSLGLFPLNVILDETNTIRYQEVHFNEFEIRALLTELADPLVKIHHIPLNNTENDQTGYLVSAEIRSGDSLNTSEIKLYWETDLTSGEVSLTYSEGDTFIGTIPQQEKNTEIRYYIQAKSSAGAVGVNPNTAPETTHSFQVLADTSAPVIEHKALARWRGDLWSPKITAQITDDLPVASAELEFRINGGELQHVPLNQVESGEWQGWFRHPAISGDLVEYRIRAVDTAMGVNVGNNPANGFWEMEIIHPIPALVLDLDSNQSSGPIIRDTLASIGVIPEYATNWPGSFQHFQSLWMILGTGETVYSMSLEESMILEDFMESGFPVYLECGNCWSNPDRFNSLNLFNVRARGTDQVIGEVLEGIDDTIGNGIVFDYVGNEGVVNQLTAVSRSDPLFKSKNLGFFTAIANTSSPGPTVASTFLIGGLIDSSGFSTRKTLVERYADFFGVIDLANCDQPGVALEMSSDFFETGDIFQVDLTLCNPEYRSYSNRPLFAILDIEGALFFWPSFSEYDFQIVDLAPGEQLVNVIPALLWPDGTGTGSAIWYAAMTNPDVSELFGTLDTFEFRW